MNYYDRKSTQTENVYVQLFGRKCLNTKIFENNLCVLLELIYLALSLHVEER